MIAILTKHNNPAGYIAATTLTFNLALAVTYLIAGDYRRSLYFFFAMCITATVVL